MFDQRLFLLVFLVLFLAIFVMCILKVKKNVDKKSELQTWAQSTKSFVINLDKNVNRLNRFLKSYRSSDLSEVPLYRFNAIRGKSLDLKNYVTDKAYDQIVSAENNGYRLRHYELTRGAVGCFLSHTKLYEQLLEDKNCDFYIIFEDDSIVPPHVINEMRYFVEHAPQDWDMLVFGVIREVVSASNTYYKKVKSWWGLFGYIINKRGAKKFIDEYNATGRKIDKQIDSMMSLMIVQNKLNVYSTKITLIKHNSDGTDIQLPVKVASNIDPFKYEGIEL